MNKSQAQQPPNANPLASGRSLTSSGSPGVNPLASGQNHEGRAPPGTPYGNGVVGDPQFSNPTAGFLGSSAAAPDGFNPDGSRVGYTFADQDAARFANGTYGGMQPPSPGGYGGEMGGGVTMTGGGLQMPRQMDPVRLPPGTLPQRGGGSTNTPYGPTVNSVPTGNVPSLVGGDALGTAMQDAQGAAYKNAAGYLDPQWKNSQDTLESKLANQGVMQNSEAWNKGMGEHARQKEFAYSQARSGAVQQGNAAQAQLFNQGLAANANQFGQNLEGGKFSNAVQQQLAAQGFTQQQIDNLEQQHRFDNSMSMRNQDINELLLQQQNPLNMMNALNSGGQVQQPQFTNTPGSNINPTDILAAIQQQYGGQLNAFNSQTGSANSANSGMAAIIASLLCDRRLKTNVRKIGMHVVGVPLYEFDYLWGEHAVGVMADELEVVKPEAVHVLRNGFKYVDYARL